jgi:hypothetical protein
MFFVKVQVLQVGTRDQLHFKLFSKTTSMFVKLLLVSTNHMLIIRSVVLLTQPDAVKRHKYVFKYILRRTRIIIKTAR